MPQSQSHQPSSPYFDAEKRCPHCGQPFRLEAPNQRYCAPRCRLFAAAERALARELERDPFARAEAA